MHQMRTKEKHKLESQNEPSPAPPDSHLTLVVRVKVLATQKLFCKIIRTHHEALPHSSFATYPSTNYLFPNYTTPAGI